MKTINFVRCTLSPLYFRIDLYFNVTEKGAFFTYTAINNVLKEFIDIICYIIATLYYRYAI